MRFAGPHGIKQLPDILVDGGEIAMRNDDAEFVAAEPSDQAAGKDAL
jgi:hypothetical protein